MGTDGILKKISDGLREIFPAVGDMTITADMPLGKIPDWDSMSAVNFQSFLEQHFQLSIPQDLLNEDATIQEVISVIQHPEKLREAVAA